MKKLRVVICVYNISGYMMAGVRKLLEYADVLLIQSPAYEVLAGDEYLLNACRWIDCDPSKKDNLIVQQVEKWGPDIVLCGGWAFPLFLQISRSLHRTGCRTVLLVDTIWRNDFRQRIHALISPFYLVPYFDYGWGAGQGQLENLSHLGFNNRRLSTGCYAADTDRFSKISMLEQKSWPHRFLYIGRYAEVKNLPRLFRAFLRAIKEFPDSDWELVCIGGGKGKIWDERPIHPRIRHLGYCAPAKLGEVLPPIGCFVLPSTFEPWGLVVQECAIMGLPLLCSTEAHATEAYLREGGNGYLFEPHDEEQMVQALLKIMRTPDEVLRTMGKESHKLGLSYTSRNWAEQVISFAKR